MSYTIKHDGRTTHIQGIVTRVTQRTVCRTIETGHTYDNLRTSLHEAMTLSRMSGRQMCRVCLVGAEILLITEDA